MERAPYAIRAEDIRGFMPSMTMTRSAPISFATAQAFEEDFLVYDVDVDAIFRQRLNSATDGSLATRI